MTTAEQQPRIPALGAPGETCTHCGALLAVDQRYCLNCGLRRGPSRVDHRQLLPAAGGAAPGAGSPTADAGGTAPPPGAAAPASAGDGGTRAISPLGAAIAIALLLLATLLGAVIGSAGQDDAQPVLVGGAAAPAGASAPTTFTADWPEGEDGWTIQLQTFPIDGTTPAQVAQAKTDATAKGAADVGVLDSSKYASLTPGLYVVYSGRFPTKGEAEAALAEVTANFPEAEVIQVSATAPKASGDTSGGASDTGSSGSSGSDAAPAASDQQLEAPASPEEALQKSKKLPNEVGTGGAPPPTDNEAPAGGGELETIG